MLYTFKCTHEINKISLNKEEYIKSKVENFNPKDRFHGTPKSYLENSWGALIIKNDYYYFNNTPLDRNVENGFFYDDFIGTKEELSNFIKELYEALCIKYNNYLKKKKENNYKSIIGKIKKLSPEEIVNLKEFVASL